MSTSDGVASLPFSKSVDSLAIKISLDRKIDFIREDEAMEKLEELEDTLANTIWARNLWKPAFNAFLETLKSKNPHDLAFILSTLSSNSLN